jgi:hypothetical protein
MDMLRKLKCYPFESIYLQFIFYLGLGPSNMAIQAHQLVFHFALLEKGFERKNFACCGQPQWTCYGNPNATNLRVFTFNLFFILVWVQVTWPFKLIKSFFTKKPIGSSSQKKVHQTWRTSQNISIMLLLTCTFDRFWIRSIIYRLFWKIPLSRTGN